MGEVFNREHDHSLSTSYERQRQPASAWKKISNWTRVSLAGLMLSSAPASAQEPQRSFSLEPRTNVEATLDPTKVISATDSKAEISQSGEIPPPPVSLICAHMLMQRKYDKEIDVKVRQGTLAVRFLRCNEKLSECRECMQRGEAGAKESFHNAKKEFEAAKKALAKNVGMPAMVIAPTIVRKLLEKSTKEEADRTNAELQSHTFFSVNPELIELGLNEVVDVEDWEARVKKQKVLQQIAAELTPSVKTAENLPVQIVPVAGAIVNEQK